jgi:uroporphyrinogen-III synthase
LQSIPIYTVGPATTRALRAVPQPSAPLQVFGEQTGTGEALAPFIQTHYGTWYAGRGARPLPPLLFLVGEKRRDIIPATLMDPALPAARRIRVDETVVYGTGVMASFPGDFAAVLRRTGGGRDAGAGADVAPVRRWVVVFSPTGCEAMLDALGLLSADADPETGRRRYVGAAEGVEGADADPETGRRRYVGAAEGVEGAGGDGTTTTTFIATIGPTTRGYLKKTFGFDAHVCAETPSPEGVWDGITAFMKSLDGNADGQTKI